MAPGNPGAALNADYLKNLTDVASHITAQGAYAVIDPHNFGRYNGQIITNTAQFQTFWQNLAGTFKSDSKIVSDTGP